MVGTSLQEELRACKSLKLLNIHDDECKFNYGWTSIKSWFHSGADERIFAFFICGLVIMIWILPPPPTTLFMCLQLPYFAFAFCFSASSSQTKWEILKVEWFINSNRDRYSWPSSPSYLHFSPIVSFIAHFSPSPFCELKKKNFICAPCTLFFFYMVHAPLSFYMVHAPISLSLSLKGHAAEVHG